MKIGRDWFAVALPPRSSRQTCGQRAHHAWPRREVRRVPATLSNSLAREDRPTAPPPKFAGVRAWIVLGMLCFVYVLNFLDRQLLAILAKPIQDSLHVSDRQLGLIGGLYFALSTASSRYRSAGWLTKPTGLKFSR